MELTKPTANTDQEVNQIDSSALMALDLFQNDGYATEKPNVEMVQMKLDAQKWEGLRFLRGLLKLKFNRIFEYFCLDK